MVKYAKKIRKAISNRKIKKGIKNLVQLANQGDARAQYDLGRYFFFELHDIDKGIYWFVLSEAGGNQQATQTLKEMAGIGVLNFYDRLEIAKAKVYGNR